MLNNIDYSEIDKQQVLRSILFISLIVPVFGVLYFLTYFSFTNGAIPAQDFQRYLMIIVISTIYGVPVYSTAMVIIYWLERLCIRKSATKKTVKVILLAEGFAGIILLILNFPFSEWASETSIVSIAGMLSILIIQLIRWTYLKTNNRIFMSAPSDLYDRIAAKPINYEDPKQRNHAVHS